MKVFLSHSSADTPLAARVAHDLVSAGVKVWLDEWEVAVGERFEAQIENGLQHVDFLIVLLTKASVASDWVNREWRRKEQHETANRRISVIPLQGEPCEVPDFLAERSPVDISGGSYRMGLGHLLAILRHHSGDTSIQLPPVEKDTVEPREDMLPLLVPIGVEVSADLCPLFEADRHGFSRAIDELAPAMRDELQAAFGFPFPGIRVRGNDLDMPPHSAVILIEEIPEALIRDVLCDDVFVDATVEALRAAGVRATPRDDSIAKRCRAKIAATDRAAAAAAGFETWDAAEYLFLALHVVLRRMASLFLDIDTARRLVDAVEAESPDLVARTVPRVISWVDLTDILRRLVDEDLSVADLPLILEALSRRPSDITDSVILTEHARHALNRQITARFARGTDAIRVLRLDTDIEASISAAVVRTSSGRYLALEPDQTQAIVAAIRAVVFAVDDDADAVPILVSNVDVRAYVRRIVSLELPTLHVVSRRDLMPDALIDEVAWINLDQRPGSAGG